MKFWICDNVYVNDDVKVKDHCYITGKYKVSTHRECNINVKLNYKFHVLFHDLLTILKNYYLHLIMQYLRKLNFKKEISHKIVWKII